MDVLRNSVNLPAGNYENVRVIAHNEGGELSVSYQN